MAVTNVLVRHRCGCTRSYPLDVPPAMVRSMAEQLMEKDCGLASCPRNAHRLLARSAPAHANGKERAG